jgi:hypothetical protein
MEDAQGFLGHPEVGFFSMLLIGVLAGWIAEKVTASDHSIFTLCGRGACQSPEYPGFWLHSYSGVRNRRCYLDSVCMALGTQSEMTRRAEMAASKRLMSIQFARA